MALLAAMTGIALDMVLHVSKALWLESIGAKLILGPAFNNGLSAQAMQQGGMGLILAPLILSAPRKAAMFYHGTLAGFRAYSRISGGAAATPSADGRLPGQHSADQAADQTRPAAGGQHLGSAGGSGLGGARGGATEPTTGKYGNAAG